MKYHRLRCKEMDRRGIVLGSNLCGYISDPYISETSGPITIKGICPLDGQKCRSALRVSQAGCDRYSLYEKKVKEGFQRTLQEKGLPQALNTL